MWHPDQSRSKIFQNTKISAHHTKFVSPTKRLFILDVFWLIFDGHALIYRSPSFVSVMTDTGAEGTMFVEEVIVTTKQGDTVVFPCRCWLGKDNSNGTIVRELIPGKPVPEEVEGKSHGG